MNKKSPILTDWTKSYKMIEFISNAMKCNAMQIYKNRPTFTSQADIKTKLFFVLQISITANVVKNPDYAISSEASRSMSSAVILIVPTSPSSRVSQLSGSCASIVPSPYVIRIPPI